MVGQLDQANMSKRIREGWEPVRAEEHPEFEAPTIEDGKHAGVIGVGGLILAKMPMETVQQRREYYANLANAQMEAVDNNLMRESNEAMPISKPSRTTQVTFGKGSLLWLTSMIQMVLHQRIICQAVLLDLVSLQSKVELQVIFFQAM